MTQNEIESLTYELKMIAELPSMFNLFKLHPTTVLAMLEANVKYAKKALEIIENAKKED